MADDIANYTFQKALSDAFEPNGPPVNTQILVAAAATRDHCGIASHILLLFRLFTIYHSAEAGSSVHTYRVRIDTAVGGWRLTVIGNLTTELRQT